ncbi:MAG: NAD(P)-dependent oxidoreductase [Steroidobacteraceae bacterium]
MRRAPERAARPMSGAKRILVWLGGGEQTLCEALSRVEGVEVVRARDRTQALSAMDDSDALVTSVVFWDADFAQALRRSPRLAWVQIRNAGFDNMERLGVPERVVVSTLADVGSAEVAVHAIALLLALLRALPIAFDAQRRQEWSAGPIYRTARTLHDLHAGVVGFGHIGRKVAALAGAFGAHVVGFARTARIDRGGVEVRALGELRATLPELDAVLICAPLNQATERLVDAEAFAAMKRGSCLVNVARGRIVDTTALVEALRSGALAGAALDVVDPEPLPAAHPLWSLPNVLLTPHTAGSGGGEAQERRIEALVLENVRRFARGEPVLHVAPLRREG